MKVDDATTTFKLPATINDDDTFLLYAFDGAIKINDEITLAKGESLLIKNEAVTLVATPSADLVLFVTNEKSEYYDGGMYSGNQQ